MDNVQHNITPFLYGPAGGETLQKSIRETATAASTGRSCSGLDSLKSSLTDHGGETDVTTNFIFAFLVQTHQDQLVSNAEKLWHLQARPAMYSSHAFEIVYWDSLIDLLFTTFDDLHTWRSVVRWV